MFKRRDSRSRLAEIAEYVYPRSGWIRATQYVWHRLRRLPDPPHRIARGVAAGVFVALTPMFGFHLLGSALIAWVIRGNVIAALLATFVGNPITYPIFAYLDVGLGQWILGIHGQMGMGTIFHSFEEASVEVWRNFLAIFTPDTAHWADMKDFFWTLFLPGLLGSIPLGLIAAVLGHMLTLPLIAAYKQRRQKRLQDRAAKLRRKPGERQDG